MLFTEVTAVPERVHDRAQRVKQPFRLTFTSMVNLDSSMNSGANFGPRGWKLEYLLPHSNAQFLLPFGIP